MPRYLFRGHGDESWSLISSFDRTFATLEDEKRDEMHKLLVSYFVAECAHYPEYEVEIENEFRRLALAQHYGLPTRLLDWSDSPYIAAYYAFSAHLTIDRGPNQSGRNNRVAVYILDTNVRGYWDGQKGVRLLSPRATRNERQKRQSGWYTHATMTHRTLEEYVLAWATSRTRSVKSRCPQHRPTW